MIWLLATGYVNDYAEVISPAVELRLEADLEAYTASTSNELAVVTLRSLEGDTIENAAVSLFEQWGIGQKGKDNGVLFLIAPNERELRLEAGYGLEPVLTDSRAGTIIREVITPRFKENDYDGGITDGVEAVITVLSRDAAAYDRPAADFNQDGGWAVLVVLFIFIMFFIWLLKHRPKTGLGSTVRSRWGGFSSGRSSGGFGGFSGGRSGGGGASGKW